MPHDKYERAAERLRDYYMRRDVEVHEGSMYLEVVGVRMALGAKPARLLLEDCGLALVKAMHSSDVGTWDYDEEGYRIWLSEVETEEVEVSETVERHTFK